MFLRVQAISTWSQNCSATAKFDFIVQKVKKKTYFFKNIFLSLLLLTLYILTISLMVEFLHYFELYHIHYSRVQLDKDRQWYIFLLKYQFEMSTKHAYLFQSFFMVIKQSTCIPGSSSSVMIYNKGIASLVVVLTFY